MWDHTTGRRSATATRAPRPGATSPEPPAEERESDMTRTYIGVVVVEVLVLLALWWLSEHFA